MNYLEKSYELKTLLLNDERIILLNIIEEEMNGDEEVKCLANYKNKMQKELEGLFDKYGSSSKEYKESLLSFYHACEKLDNHPLVKKYNNQYEIVNNLYKEINDILFNDLIGESCHAHHRR